MWRRKPQRGIEDELHYLPVEPPPTAGLYGGKVGRCITERMSSID